MICENCGRELPPEAAICPSCGWSAAAAAVRCPSCGAGVPAGQRYCGQCGKEISMAPPPPPPPPQPAAGPAQAAAPPPPPPAGATRAGQKLIYPSSPPKNLVAATLLSFICGLGQLYLGQTNKGAAMLGGGLILTIVTAGAASLFLIVLSMVDAYLIGKKLEAGRPVGEWEFF